MRRAGVVLVLVAVAFTAAPSQAKRFRGSRTLANASGERAEAKQRLESERAADPRPVPRSRPKRLKEAKRRLNTELWTEARANEAYETYRARGRMKDGRRFGGPPKPYTPPPMRTERAVGSA
jgi:hypothetical protein